MDKFVSAPEAVNTTSKDATKGKSYRYNPYPVPKSKERSFETWKENNRIQRIMAPLRKSNDHDGNNVSISAAKPSTSKNILTTLRDKSNPITHSLKGSQQGHVDSCVTGHQRSDGRIPRIVIKSRAKKLREQRVEKGRKECGVLAGTRIYIGGYLAGTTDLEMKRLVILEGGEIQTTAAGATHIITSRGLSASKTQKHLNGSRINSTHIVTPEWVTDSIAVGKRKKEWDYAILKKHLCSHHG